MGARFTVQVRVRSYELDANGHLNHANYHRYGEHARAEHFTAAGCSFHRVLERGMGFVLLETHARFLRELRDGDELEIDSRVEFGTGKTFEIGHTITRADSVVACEITCRLGLIDATARRLVADPAGRLRELATDPGLLGL
ncbi:MAG: acyl-CoA thioesterase [Pseudonocardia sp.]